MSAKRLRDIAHRLRDRCAAEDLLAIADEWERREGWGTFYAIHYAEDSVQIYGEYEWVKCDGPNDWSVADDAWSNGDESAFRIDRFHVEPGVVRQPPEPWDANDYDCLACWQDEGWLDEDPKRRPRIACPECGKTECPKASAHVNSCTHAHLATTDDGDGGEG